MTGRDNGLSAASYAPLADVDPPVVDHVLDLLRDAGVAAYAEPWPGETEPYRNVRPPSTPQLRVYVDRGALTLARDLVSASLPGLRAAFLADAAARADREVMAAADVDAAWSRIVAGWDDDPDPAVGRWSAAEDVEPPEPTGGSGLSDRLVRRADRVEDDDLDVWVERPDDDQEPVDDPDDHYVPPPPPPLPQPDTVARFAWAGVLGGPGLLMASGLFGLGLPSWAGLLAVVAFVAGFVTLVARMKDRPDDGWDDGAVV